ncbi:SAV_2336 N-terminal domain-related protein [Actinacidiphila bryophytorum]|uniref:SAV_2336 N-terminal domain-related protein n=1 Tax=Actinacidiphila bryophytorum TaxID=1436133 RepID=UPI00203F706C|nr:SAV_2336 N-terminal domain-related protein [Actinacidiphila bryophytorum]
MGRLHTALAGAGLDLNAEELADALWLALAAPPPAPPGSDTAPGRRPEPVQPPQTPAQPPQGDPEPPPAPRPPQPPPGAARTPVYALADPRPGTGAAAVRIPGVPGLPDPLSVVRALRPLKRRVSSQHRYELDEAATAEAIAETGGLDVVLRPERARWLDLVLAVDDGLSLRVWQDTLAELTRVLGTSGIFRTVRRCGFATTPVNSAVVDGDRTVVLAVTDGVGPAWRSGEAQRVLARWARKAPTAVLDPLPVRLWPGTALPAERLRVRAGRPAPANHHLRAYDPWLPPHLAEPLRLPVPVLELADWSLAPWAELIGAHGGSATLRVVDAAAPPVPPLPAAPPGTAAARLVAFQEAVSPEAYELAAHLAAVDPLTLPVMRVVQAAALPGSGPSCLAEVLLSGVMHVDRPLAGFDVYTFAPELRPLLRMVVPADDARRTVDAVSDFITPRLGRSGDFPAVIASATGTLSLPVGGTPFAEVPRPAPAPGPAPAPAPVEMSAHPAAEYVVAVRAHGTDVATCGYLVDEGLVLTIAPDSVPAGAIDFHVHLHPDLGGGSWVPARQLESDGPVRLLSITDLWSPPPTPPCPWGTFAGGPDAATVTLATVLAVVEPHGTPAGRGLLEIWETRFGRGGPLVAAVLRPGGADGAPYRLTSGVSDQGGAVFHDGTLVGLVTPAAAGGRRSDRAMEPVAGLLTLFSPAAYAGPPLTAEPPTTVGWPAPPRPGFLTFDQDYALARLEQLIQSEPAIGTVVVKGLADGPVKVAAEYVHRNRPSLQRVVWLDVRELPRFMDSYDYVRLRRSAPGASVTRWLVVLDGRAAEVTGPEKQRVLDELTGIGARILLLDGPYGNLHHRSIRVEQGREWNQTAVTGPHPQEATGSVSDAVGAATVQLLSVLPWLDSPVSFEVLGALWAPNLLTDVFRQPAVEGAFRIDWRGRRVHMADGSHATAADGRDLAVLLLTAYAEGVGGRSVPDPDEFVRHVLALSRQVPLADVTGPTAQLFARAAFQLLGQGRGEAGVRLGERACEATPDSEGLRVRLTSAAMESGIEAFVALSPASLTAYGNAEGVIDDDRDLEWLQSLMAAVARGGPLPSAGPRLGLEWCRQHLGDAHPLTRDLAAAIQVLDERRPGRS